MKKTLLTYLRKTYRKVSRYFLRKRLKNKNFTILSPTCIAGVIYHELGHPFLSPTINLWMHDKDFYKFVNNLKGYLAHDLVFVEGIDETPTAYLDDILIHFNHYHSDEEAREKWNTRKARMNYDNLFIIGGDNPDGGVVTDEDIASLGHIACVNKLVFTIRDLPRLDYTMKLPKDPEKECINVYMFDKTSVLGRYRWEKTFDYVSWLNKGLIH